MQTGFIYSLAQEMILYLAIPGEILLSADMNQLSFTAINAPPQGDILVLRRFKFNFD
jgi:hypothetical protein